MKPEVMQLAERLRQTGGWRWLGVYAVGATEISLIGWSGPAPPAHPRFPRDRGLCGAAAASGAPVVVNDVTSDPRYLETLGTTLSEMVVPVKRASGEVVGLIDVESDRRDAFSPIDVALLEEHAALLAAQLWK
jgi:L-methionine (R)-S-oxide reductase